MNVGGCAIPVGLSLYEMIYLAAFDPHALIIGIGGCLVNIAVCYSVAQPVKGVGIAMPALLSPVMAAALALLLAPKQLRRSPLSLALWAH